MSDPNQKPETLSPSLSGALARGAFLMIFLRFAVRLSGLISLVVTARLLTPEDFGIVGSASLILGLISIVQDMGFTEQIARDRNRNKDTIDTLWTARLMLAVILASLLFLISPLLAALMDDGRVEGIIKLIAFVPVIDALGSPASALYIRDLDFGREFRLKLTVKGGQVVSVIIAALILKSYWALAIGIVAASFFGVLSSHLYHPYLPRLTLSEWNNVRHFSFWTSWRNGAVFWASSFDEFVVRRLSDSMFFGLYHVAHDLARVFVEEMIAPIKTALLPIMSELNEGEQRLKNSLLSLNGSIMLLATAVGGGVYATAPEIVAIILGPQWSEAAPIFAVLSIGVAANAVALVNHATFTALDHQPYAAGMWTARVVAYSVTSVIAGLIGGPDAVMWAFSLISALALIVEFLLLQKISGSDGFLIAIIWRPALALTAMVALLSYVTMSISGLGLMLTVLIKVGIGAATYIAVISLLWKLAKSPAGGEQMFLSMLAPIIRK